MTSPVIPAALHICAACGELASGPACDLCGWNQEAALRQRTAEVIEMRRERRREAERERAEREFWHRFAMWLGVAIAYLGGSLIMLLFWAGVRAGLRLLLAK